MKEVKSETELRDVTNKLCGACGIQDEPEDMPIEHVLALVYEVVVEMQACVRNAKRSLSSI